MDWLRRLFAASPDPIPRLGNGNLTFLGGTVPYREQFGPPHVCEIPPVEAARFLGSDYGAVWRCDCAKQYRLIWTEKQPYVWDEITADKEVIRGFVDVTARPLGRPGLINPPPK